MMTSNVRTSTSVRHSTSTGLERPNDSETKRDMWSTMLSSVASGKRLPEKNVLVLGGDSESQREFRRALTATEEMWRAQDRQSVKQPPIANEFALGYTYHDVLDADQEDTLARISMYLLSIPSPAFTPLLQPLLTPQTIPNTLVVVLLDWSQPWYWMRQLRDWIRLLRSLVFSVDEECKDSLEGVMDDWRERGRGSNCLDKGGINTMFDNDINLPLGPGEWEEPLGLPLCVVCQNSDQIELLERERAWKEEQFDYVLQFLRTVLLKHGSSLIYTMPSLSGSLQSLVHSSLGIHSLLKRQPIKHNVIDRDKVLVPPNWDSWGKIRVLRDGFDVEDVNKRWSIDVNDSTEASNIDEMSDKSNHMSLGISKMNNTIRGAVEVYEEMIRDPGRDTLEAMKAATDENELEVSSFDTQSFLASQLEILEKGKQGTDLEMDSNRRVRGQQSPHIEEGHEGRVNEHIGPVQFNVGGIQMDADDMLQKLQDQHNYHKSETMSASAALSPQNDALASFFENLLHRGNNSGTSSPKPNLYEKKP